MCRYYKFGYRKFADKCRNLDVEEKFENKQCDITKCDNRHPRPCNFYRDYGRCKYLDFCKYEHVHQEINKLTEKFECRLDKIEKIIDEKDSVIRNLKIEIEANNERLEVCEKIINSK